MHIVMIMVTRAFLKFLSQYGRTYFHPPTNLCEGNIFSRVRLSVHRGSVWLQPGPVQTCSLVDPPTSLAPSSHHTGTPKDMFKPVHLDLTMQGPPPTWDYLKSWRLAFDLNAFMFPVMLQFGLLLTVRTFYVQFYFSALALNLLA